MLLQQSLFMTDELLSKLRPRILMIRGQRVMLDSDLAAVYEVTTGALNRAVRRNMIRFPPDFMFQLTPEEDDVLRCQIGIAKFKDASAKRRFVPYVFTEQGVAMLSSVLRSERAALANIEIMRAFVEFRKFLLTNKELARKLSELEQRYDSNFKQVFDAIRKLMSQPENPKRKIGFHSDES